ncbi:hypothetical protein I8H83_03210 [Candidatus Saccharibacteria bacterium]|nr:hypothetical protein [Candidatus Saccharibacteria bacterium]
MYTLKSIVRRGSALGAAVAVFAAAIVPTAPVFADALNPLTERSLLLSSSAPGWQDMDGSGNSYDAPNAALQNYAPAGSGPNGRKTGETFTFKVSSTAEVKGFSLQYCTQAAGYCQSPGNNTGDARDDLPTAREANEGPGNAHANKRSDFNFVGTWNEGTTAGTYEVRINNATSTGWTLATDNLEDDDHSGNLSGKDNYATLVNEDGGTINNGQLVQIIFRPSETTYITNPGSDAFFVKINTYSSDTSLIGTHNDPTPNVQTDHTVIDGGVTVANVMTDSIHITTKVLETMAFSVGVHNRDTDVLDGPGGSVRNGTCDPIQVVDANRLNLGNPNAEYSLETGRAWDVNSYWRLSSNSSGGATVYYSGDTLRNTVGDFIRPLDPTATLSNPGTEQFGLGFVDDAEMQSEVSSSFLAEVAVADSPYSLPSIDPLVKTASYAGGSGNIGQGVQGETIDAEFAFDEDSMQVPAQIAQNTDGVLSCATAKMRYVGNIAADTPAGVYTTKINYLAAPQY